MTADNAQHLHKLVFISAFAHKAHTGDQSAIVGNQSFDVRLQRYACVLLKIRRVATMTTEAAI